MDTEPGLSGVRLCPICEKFDSQNNFKLNSCRGCWKWFKLNIDYYIQTNKICPNKCEEFGQLASCDSCRLKSFLKVNEYRGHIRQCSIQNCGQKTLQNGKNPRCSSCRRLKRELPSKDCTCNSTSQCSLCALTSVSQHNSSCVQPHQDSATDAAEQSQVQQHLSPKPQSAQVSFHISDMASHSPENAQAEELNIDISAIPKNVQKEAKEQLFFDKYWTVKIQKLKLPQEAFPTTQRAKKRPREDSFSKNEEHFSINSVDQRTELPRKIQNHHRQSSSYSMKQLSDTKIVLTKPSGPTDLSKFDKNSNHVQHSTPVLLSTVNNDSQDGDPIPGTSREVINNRFSNSVTVAQFAIPKKKILAKRHISTVEFPQQTEPFIESELSAAGTPVDQTSQSERSYFTLECQNVELERNNAELVRKNSDFERRNAELERHNAELERRNAELEPRNVKLKRRNDKLERRNAELERRNEELELIVAATRSLNTRTSSPLINK